MLKVKDVLLIAMLVLCTTVVTACGDASTSVTQKENNADETEATSDKQKINKIEEKDGQYEIEESNSSDKENTEDQSSSSTTESNNSEREVKEEDNQAKNNSDDSKMEGVSVELTNGEDAIQYLRKELNMEDNEDIVFDDMGGSLESDSYGAYYKITLYSKELQKSGGSGTLEKYKVYQDGKYELDY